MKRYFNIGFLSLSLLVLLLGACTKQENKVVFNGGTAPVATLNVTADLALAPAAKTSQLFKLSWTNPAYSFTSGVSSQDVSYAIQIDTVGSNFTNPNMQELSISKELSYSMTIGDLNTMLAKMSLSAGMPHNLQMRIISSLNGAVPLVSNVVTLNGVRPFEDFAIPVPASNRLFITGGATPGGWQAGNAGETVPSKQEFTQVSRGVFEIASLQLSADQSYLLLPVYGSWSSKYGGTKGNNENNPLGDDFKEGGSDLKAPGATGNYKITVNFVIGRFTVTKL